MSHTAPSVPKVTIEQIDAILPQYHCGACGYPTCQLYAQAIVNNGEPITKCRPGRKKVLEALSALMGEPVAQTAVPAPARQPAVNGLPPEVAAKVAAARAQSQAKYAAKGVAQPKVLRDKMRDGTA